MIAVVTDSASQMPADLAARLGVLVVPVTVTVNGTSYLEGEDLDAVGFYDLLAGFEGVPELSTSQPSAADFVTAFAAAVDAGATSIVAVLVGSAYSGAINSATVAASSLARIRPAVAIEIVDTATASFGIAAAAWAAADAAAAGGSVLEVRRAAEQRAAESASVFCIDGTDLADRSGRFDGVELGTRVPVLASDSDGLHVLGEVDALDDGIDLMVDCLTSAAARVVVAIGRAAPATDVVTDQLVERIRAVPSVTEIVEYRVGASIAAHTGPFTVGGFVFPAPPAG